eukprot:TRINITY_DN62981_c0_g1_i1.p1 TRINITY_DN62981_c0_g1~~TRINITY_DN62981_c0_g1_i1.p1  ORF type:complete len:329 (-),score=31.01 TRINITY_DN62981_c0_g1_i1:207-1193(-)
MEIDTWQLPKRRRLEDGAWWEAPPTPPSDSLLWGLCDALGHYASSVTRNGCPVSVGCTSAAGPASLGCHSGHVAAVGVSSTAPPAYEPLLRSLTQLANAAAVGVAVRRQLVAKCNVHVPLLQLMQQPVTQPPVITERCCRLLHWLCVRIPENREALASVRSPRSYSTESPQPLSFVEAVLSAIEAHPQNRGVLAHALRALASLLPCQAIRNELQQHGMQPRLLTCLSLAGNNVEQSAVRSVCRWLPGVSGRVICHAVRNGPLLVADDPANAVGDGFQSSTSGVLRLNRVWESDAAEQDEYALSSQPRRLPPRSLDAGDEDIQMCDDSD